ncbi:ADP-ribosylglycohydrolase family protein [Maribacter sp. CXY002]|uniref:ADP-ribosylglycohydrolase family protein n=1 Tax=Maribacter luteocoastalis TaxID=3407671 RepID=UPI003B679C7E
MKNWFLLPLILILSCNQRTKTGPNIKSPQTIDYGSDSLILTNVQYYDKILGALVGSAIGDAMGASTEMWDRKAIQLKYGYITGLTPAVREQSPEGTWDHNLMAGATTDDTRWKYLMIKYFEQYTGKLNPNNFSKFIIEYYATLTNSLVNEETKRNIDYLDDQIEKIEWIKEWARVALAYQDNTSSYLKATNRFYGGEMSCAGQLYTPMLGLVTKNPTTAYNLAYDHSIFDIGYAKDISATVAAMTNMALQTKNIDSLLDTATFTDPLGYQDSRLVGRIPFTILKNARTQVNSINNLVIVDSSFVNRDTRFEVPKGFPGTTSDWIKQEMLYQLLEKDKRAIAFHSAEIWQIMITGIAYGNGDFEKTMQFIVNYGRDNDTVAAVAGMILGAQIGYTNLPESLKHEIIKVNKNYLHLDLETMAKTMAP